MPLTLFELIPAPFETWPGEYTWTPAWTVWRGPRASIIAALAALPAPLSAGVALCVTGTAPEPWAFGVISPVSSFTLDGLPSGISVGN